MAQANPFDQFDGPTSKSGSTGANPFDQFDKTAYVSTYTGLARNAIAGGNEGIASVLGAPVDATTWALNKGIQGIHAATGLLGKPKNLSSLVTGETTGPIQIERPFGGSESIKRGIGAIGGDNPDTVEAQTPAERIVRSGGEGAGSMVTGAGAVSLGRKALTTVAPRAYSVMEGLFGKPTIENAAIGAASGAGGQAAAEISPEGYEPAARIAGSVAGGFGPLAGRVIYEGGKFAVNAARTAAQPFTKSGQEALAGSRIAGAASDVNAVRANLENGPQELVPGSKPTTFQQTGDMGLGQLERKVRTENPEDFIQRASEQNAARGSAISGVQQTGSPADVATHFRGVRNALDTSTEASVRQARQTADQHIAAMGGAGSAETHGELMRSAAQAARDTAKEKERALWQAVDPENKLIMPGTPIASTAKRVEGELSKSAKPLDGEERAIFDVAKQYTDKTPFHEVMDLRSRISTAMSEERRTNGFTPVYGRLVRLRTAVEDTIDRAVENQAKVDKQAVAQGRISEENTFAAKLMQEVRDFHARRNAEMADGGSGAGGASAVRSAPVSGAVRTEGSARGAAGLPQGNSGISGEGVPLDAAAAGRLKAASTATRERAQTFDEGATGGVLKPGARAGEYRAPDSLVPSKIFHPGPNGGESVRSYIGAVGEAQAVPAIADYAAFSLRRAAMRPDGTIDTAKALAWAKQHDAALAELPPSVRSRLANPGRAEEAVTQAVAARKDRMDAFDHSELAKVMGHDSSDVVRQIGSIFNSRDAVAKMQELATAANGNPAAKAGLRRAIIEHIRSQFLSNAEAGTTGASTLKSDAFQTFMRTKTDVLAQVFQPEEIGALRAVASDLQRANRTINATKLAGGSNTAQDTAHRAADAGSIMNKIAIEAAAATAGHAATQSVGGGVLGWLGARTVSALRDAGISHVDDLVKEAMLNPELARALLQKVPAPSDKGAIERIVRAAKQIAVSGPVIGASQDNK
jgi:hypothetical protein